MGDTWDFIQDEIRASMMDSSWIEKTYRQLIEDISFELKAFLGVSHNTSYADAMENMKDDELKAFKSHIKTIDKKIYDKIKYRVNVSRLEGITTICRSYVHSMSLMQEERLRREYVDLMEKTRRLCLWSFGVEHDDEDYEIDYDDLFMKKWFDNTFHGRIWHSQTYLCQHIKVSIAKGLALGYGHRNILKYVAGNIDFAKYAFLRLYKTEAYHFVGMVMERMYKKFNVKEYIFNASKAERLCVVCSGLDKTKHKVSDILVGANYPTMHPRCDCLTRPSLYLPREMPFEQWEKLVFGK